MLYLTKSALYILALSIFVISNAKATSNLHVLKITDTLELEDNESGVDFDSLEIKLLCDAGIDPERARCKEFYLKVLDWLETPYRYGGNSKKGIDCSRLVIRLTKKIYYDSINGSAASIYNNCSIMERDQLAEGDLVFFKINRSYISHVGVYLYDGLFVHATVGKGVMVNSLDEEYYKKYFFGAGRNLN